MTCCNDLHCNKGAKRSVARMTGLAVAQSEVQQKKSQIICDAKREGRYARAALNESYLYLYAEFTIDLIVSSIFHRVLRIFSSHLCNNNAIRGV